MSLDSSLSQDTSALPGGNKILSWESLGRRHWRQIVGLQLPDDATLGQLVDKFFLSVDWFMMVCALHSSCQEIKTTNVCLDVRGVSVSTAIFTAPPVDPCPLPRGKLSMAHHASSISRCSLQVPLSSSWDSPNRAEEALDRHYGANRGRVSQVLGMCNSRVSPNISPTWKLLTFQRTAQRRSGNIGCGCQNCTSHQSPSRKPLARLLGS